MKEEGILVKGRFKGILDGEEVEKGFQMVVKGTEDFGYTIKARDIVMDCLLVGLQETYFQVKIRALFIDSPITRLEDSNEVRESLAALERIKGESAVVNDLELITG